MIFRLKNMGIRNIPLNNFLSPLKQTFPLSKERLLVKPYMLAYWVEIYESIQRPSYVKDNEDRGKKKINKISGSPLLFRFLDLPRRNRKGESRSEELVNILRYITGICVHFEHWCVVKRGIRHWAWKLCSLDNYGRL